MTFDDGGLLYGVDNDGPTNLGWRKEEVLQIKSGANYGFPYEGTFGSFSIRDDNPIWIVNTVGSAGVQWAGNVGLGPGLLMGSCGRLELLSLSEYGDAQLVQSRSDLHMLLATRGCVTAIEAGPQQSIVIGVFGANVLQVLTVMK